MKPINQTSWRPHPDVSEQGIAEREALIRRDLRLAKIDVDMDPHGTLPEPYCQVRAARDRETLERRGLRALARCASAGQTLIMFTLVPPAREFQRQALDRRCARECRRHLKEGMSWTPAIERVVACYEVDHVQKNGSSFWQATVHGVAAVSAGTNADARAIAARAWRMSSGTDVYRPLLCRPVTSARSAVRYIFKGLQYGSTTSRVTYVSDEGRKRSRKLALKAAPRDEYLRSLPDFMPADRAFSISRDPAGDLRTVIGLPEQLSSTSG